MIALLSASDPEEYASHIGLTIEYLVTLAENGPLKDKWNIAITYSCMLLVRALVSAMHVWDNGKLKELGETTREFRIPTVICQAIARTLRDQRDDGSWEASVDQTAYGILSLSHVIKLPWPRHMTEMLRQRIELGRDFLRQLTNDDVQKPSYVWVEKVTYASPILSKVYALAAMQAPISPDSWTQKTQGIFDLKSDQFSSTFQLISSTPLFDKGFPSYQSLIVEESALYLKRLLAVTVCSRIFPVKESRSNRYKTIIPLTWVICNHRLNLPMSPKQIWFMMIISDLIYQCDEYMEKTMKLMVHDNQDALGDFIREQCGCQNMWLRSGFPRRETAAIGGLKNLKEVHKSPKNNSMILKEAKSVLGTMIAYVLQQPALLRRPSWQRLVAQELCGFLLAHIRHVRYNDQFFQQA